MLAQVPDAASGELDVFLGECDALRYAPAAEAASATSPTSPISKMSVRLAKRGLEIAERLAEELR